MADLKKHNFGQLVFCKECGRQVGSVWAESYDLARTGQGLCDDCLEKSKQSGGRKKGKKDDEVTLATTFPVVEDAKEPTGP